MLLRQDNSTSPPWGTRPEVGGTAIAGFGLSMSRQLGVRGFTLVELLVVMAIMAMVIALAVPSFNGSTASQMEAAARSLAAGLRWTRSHAVTGNQVAELTIDLVKRQFLVPGSARMRALPSDAKLTLYTARSQVETEARGSIRFFPDGSSSGGRITVASDRLAFIVDVDWFTGKVRLIESGPDSASEVQR
jgi:general secretion pathway protein H